MNVTEASIEVTAIPLADIEPNPDQPRNWLLPGSSPHRHCTRCYSWSLP